VEGGGEQLRGHGTRSVRIAPTGDGGSRLHVDWDYTDISRTQDKALVVPDPALPYEPDVSRMWVSALDRYAQSDLD